MRLGKDALVLSKDKNQTYSLGFLSQSFNTAIKSENLLVPIVTWDSKRVLQNADDGSLIAVTKFSPFKTEEEIFQQFEKIEKTGLLIFYIYFRRNLHHHLQFTKKSIWF
jgi:hypothetical protein